ncbi:MAG: helix-turn-helix domain-containing protein [Actinomycetia bacterium]|nr:helix-turn-helix domain-containing protein [Actinomycetes bacterium]
MSDKVVSVLLTVEEAGVLLRIGRTKAYAMAREWRETDGRSGLPVVDLGHVLRVPRRALEELIGAELTDADSPFQFEQTKEQGQLPAAAESPIAESTDMESARTPLTMQRTRRRQERIANQLDLFDSQPRSN